MNSEELETSAKTHRENNTEEEHFLPSKQPNENEDNIAGGDNLVTSQNVSEEKRVVPDGGYGWFVVIGCFLSHVIIGGYERCDGVFYLQFRSRFDKSAQLSAWPGALVSTIRLFMGPAASYLCNKFSVRTVTIIGSFFAALGCIITGYAPDFFFLFFSISAVQGIARGLMYAPSLIIVGMYFDKYRGIAAGLGSSGVGVGTFLVVPMAQFLFDYYGFQGAFLILSGLAFNGILTGMLFRPLSMHYKFSESGKKNKNNIGKDASKENAQLIEVGDLQLSPVVAQSKKITKRDVSFHKSESEKMSCIKSSMKIIFPTENKKENKTEKRKLFHFNLMKDPSFCLFCFAICLFTFAFKATFTFIPALVKSKGMSETDAALVLSITGGIDTLGRIAAGFMFDLPFFKHNRAYIYNMLVFGIAAISFILPSLSAFWSFSVVSAMYGALTGAYLSQKSVIIVDILGPEHLTNSFGILVFWQGVGICFGPPLSGAFRDAFGGFTEAFYLGGAMMLSAGLLMVAGNVFLRLKRRRAVSETNIEVENIDKEVKA